KEGYVNLYDLDWKNANGEVVGKSYSLRVQGMQSWKEGEYWAHIPQVDDSGESTQGHRYYFYLYGHAADSVVYDDVSLVLDDSVPQTAYDELDESSLWIAKCQKFENQYPLTECGDDWFFMDTIDKLSGQSSLV